MEDCRDWLSKAVNAIIRDVAHPSSTLGLMLLGPTAFCVSRIYFFNKGLEAPELGKARSQRLSC